MDKALPSNIDAERAVLGSVLLNRDAIIAVAAWLKAEDFYQQQHGWIYEAMLNCYNNRIPPDTRTVSDELRRHERLDAVGGLPYLLALIDAVPSSYHIEYYAQIVQRTSLMRQLITAGGKIAAIGYDESGDLEATLDKAESTLFEVSQRRSTQDFVHIGQVIDTYYEQINYLQEHRGEVVGVPTGFRDFDEITGGLQRSDLIILAARPAVGKCLTANSLIDNPVTGERLRIEDYVQQQLPLVSALSGQGTVRNALVKHWIDSGIQPCFRVRTRSGREVEATAKHPFHTINGWTPLSELQVGDCIGVPRELAVFGQDESLPLDRVRLLAYLIAEGGLTASSPMFTNTDPVLIEDFKAIIAAQFPECAIRQHGISYAVARPGRGGVPTTNPLYAWLETFGLRGKLAKDKFFPAAVWRWSRPYLAAFLRVLMSCDGSIYLSSGRQRIEFTVAARQLAADVHHAFVRFGIVSRLYETSRGAWRVAVTEPASIERYQQDIGWLGEKVSRFCDMPIPITKRGSNIGHAPSSVWPLVHAAARQHGLSLVELARRSGETTKVGKFAGYNPHMKRSLPRGRLANYANVLDNDHLRALASADVFWDAIVAIEPIGPQQVYDLTVPDGENFVAQDIFVHNTSFAMSIAHGVASQGNGVVGVFSLEMSRDQLVQRLIAMETGLDTHKLRTGHIRDNQLQTVMEAMSRLAAMPIYIEDTAGMSIMEVRSKARRLQSRVGIDLLVIDYLQLMQGRGRENRVQEVGEISRGLKALARELNVPVIALSQLSRGVESRNSHVPMLSDLRESGCVTGDTHVFLPELGTYRRIDELVGQSGFQVLALNEATWQHEPRTVTKAFATGFKPVFRLTTRLGRSIRATANHKFLSFDGWKRLDELAVGERLALPRTLPSPQQPSMSEDELALLGHLIGDGCTLPHQPIHYTTNDITLAETVATLATRIFGERIVPRVSPERDWYQVFLASAVRLTHGVRNPIAAWLDDLGVFGLRSHEKFVPAKVFQQPASSIARFLRHLWSTDGCIHLGQDKRHYAGIYYATSSIRLAQNVQSLLLRLGINATMRRVSQGAKGRDMINVIVSGKSDIERFFEQVGAIGINKTAHQEAISLQIAGKTANTNRDIIPNTIWRRYAVPAMQEAALTTRQLQAQLGNAYCGTQLYRQNVSRERATRLARIVRSEEIQRLAQSDVYWDEIVSIEPDGEEYVYDLTVEGLHNFVANDITIHNSIEQDADIVLFIYREELYEPETDKKGIAEIHLAKHRNGPVGVVPMRFDASTTRFMDLSYRTPEGY